MMLQSRLPFIPEGAKIISDNLALCQDEETSTFYNASGPIFSFHKDDTLAKRTAAGMLTSLGLAGPIALAKELDVHRNTVTRHKNQNQEGGVEALEDAPRIREPYKLSEEKQEQAQALLNRGMAQRKVAREVGVSEGTIRYAIQQGRLLKPAKNRKRASSVNELKRPLERAREDADGKGGLAVKRHRDRALASAGCLKEAAPKFMAAEAVRMAGVLLGLGALLNQGLLTAGRKVYGELRNSYFGLRSVFLILAFMALLRIKSAEQLSDEAPGELGLILGLDRAPEVKTLRRKLKELAGQEMASELAAELTRGWVENEPERLGYLYVDGHVRPYNGRKHKLPKAQVARRRLCMPATTDFWVNDEQADPLFYVTAAANDSLLSMMDKEILPEVRRLVGKKRRVTLIFDREGWSPDTFKKWYKDGFDVITYRKGTYEAWPEECFMDTEVTVCGKKVTYRLGQRSVKLRKDFWMREVRRLCDSGHQTSVMSTRQDVTMEHVALRMFSRWTQENFFRYMRHEFNLDHLCTYDVEAADPERSVPNPARKVMKKKLGKLKQQLKKLEQEYGTEAFDNPESVRRTMRGFKISQGKLGKQIRALRKQCRKVKASLDSLPERVAVKEVMDEKEIVALERERKVLTDQFKMVAYRAESSLLDLLEPYFARCNQEGRKFLKAAFRLPADLIPDDDGQLLTVRLYSMPSHRENKALKALCEVVNMEEICYPGTQLRLVFETV